MCTNCVARQCAEGDGGKVSDDVVNVSHLYEYLAVPETNVTSAFALTGATACCVCGAGRYDSDANSSTVCVHHRKCGAGHGTSAPGNNTLNP